MYARAHTFPSLSEAPKLFPTAAFVCRTILQFVRPAVRAVLPREGADDHLIQAPNPRLGNGRFFGRWHI